MQHLHNRYLNDGDTLVARRQKVLVIFAGQSNSMTSAAKTALSDQSLANSYSNVTMWHKQAPAPVDPPVWTEQANVPLSSVVFQTVDSVGPEVTMMRDLDRADPTRFVMVHMGIDGSSLTTHWNPNGTYPTGSNLFALWMSYALSAAATAQCNRCVVVWCQGESDAQGSGSASAYGANLAALRSAIISSLSPTFGTAISFVYTRASQELDTGTCPFASTLYAQQTNFNGSAPGVRMVSLDSITLASGLYLGVHYTADGYQKVGHLIAGGVANELNMHIPPVASFSYSSSQLQVTFTDTSTSPSSSVASWSWSFGDGGTSSAQSPVHTYAGSGTYGVTLTITNGVGDSSTYGPISVTVSSGFAGVTRDATKLWYVPATSGEWSTFLTDIGSALSTPDSLYGLQETTGNMLDAIGSIPLPVAVNTGRGQADTEWARTAMTTSDGTTRGCVSTSASLPDLSTSSVVVLVLVKPTTAPAVTRNLVYVGSTNTRAAGELASTPRIAAFQSGGTRTNGTNSPNGTTRWMVVKYDRANSSFVVYTDQEKISPVWVSSSTGKQLCFGGCGSGGSPFAAAGASYFYACRWDGAKAEAFTDAEARKLGQGMTGLTFPW